LLAGVGLGRVIAIHLAENWLDQYSKLMTVQQDASSLEAHNLLDVMKTSPFPFCSDAEIAYFRELVYKSESLKDAGRIRDGKIECSATAGRPLHFSGQLSPRLALLDGTFAYKNLEPVKSDTLQRVGLQVGSAYVVIGSNAPPSVGPIPIQLNVTMQDAVSNRPGSRSEPSQPGNTPDLTTGSSVRRGDVLYTTQCSAFHFNCVTVSTPVSEAVRGERGWVAGCAGAGEIVGTLLGLLFSLLYRRSRSREQQLRRAIASDKLNVNYQPIVSLASGKIVGAEALVRWEDEEGNTVGPDVFVKIAEENGFVGGITRLVVRRALKAFSDTLSQCPGFRISINASAADLGDPTFLPMLDDSLKWAKVQSKSVVIEITETSTANREVAMETIRSLRRRGHSIHIDDFGTGYSSLSYLLYLSVDTIKIDKAFTRVIGTEAVTVAILPQILAMAKSLNLEVIVEGVENSSQENYFSTADRPMYGQGWLYGRPMPASEFQRVLAENWAQTPVLAEPVAERNLLSIDERLIVPGPVEVIRRSA